MLRALCAGSGAESGRQKRNRLLTRGTADQVADARLPHRRALGRDFQLAPTRPIALSMLIDAFHADFHARPPTFFFF